MNQCWNIVNCTLRNKLQWNLNRNSCILIQEDAFENAVWKMAAILSRPKSTIWDTSYSWSTSTLAPWRRHAMDVCVDNPSITRRVRSQNASNEENICFLCCWPGQVFEQRGELLLIWVAMMLMRRHCNGVLNVTSNNNVGMCRSGSIWSVTML